jgi:hypothetical protein
MISGSVKTFERLSTAPEPMAKLKSLVRAETPILLSVLHTIGAIFNELRRCWVPPPSSQARTGTEITVRFAFKRNGEILAAPRVTYASAGASPDTRATYVNTIKAALSRCTPMSFSEGLAAVIVGHPFAIRFVDDRTGLSQ